MRQLGLRSGRRFDRVSSTSHRRSSRGDGVHTSFRARASNFLLVTCFKITFDEQLVAIVALYDDPATRAWLDEFGVLRVAVDFGLIDEDASAVTGILVLVADGNPV